MIKKQNLRTNVLAAAVLSLTSVGIAQAADLKVSAPQKSTAAQQQAVEGIIVKYRAGSAAAGSRTAKLAVVNSALTRASLGGATAGASAARVAAFGPQVERRLGVGADLIRLKSRLGGAELAKVLAELKADPTVEYAVADAVMYPVDANPVRGRTAALGDAKPNLVPNDPNYAAYNWHFFSPTGGVNAPAAWDVSRGAGVVVAVLDTGIVPHPDFAAGTVLEGYDFISSAERSRRATDDRVPGALDQGDWAEAAGVCYTGSPKTDSSWHGTHVAGTVAEATNNGVGMAGLAFESTVLPVRVLGRCGGTLSDIADAITWASGGTVAGIPANENPADIINMSLGGAGACDAVYQDAINGAVSRGTLVVVAAGNDEINVSGARPANCNNVVSVGATGITGQMAYYSNFGTLVDLSGPGGGVTDGNPNGYVWQGIANSTTAPNGTYTYGGKAGTSMAAPHVAAVAALVQSALSTAGKDPLAPAAMETLLKQSARTFPVSINPAKPIGTGIVDAKAALDLALQEPCTEDCGPTAIALTNKVAVGGIGGASGSETLYSFEAIAGKTASFITYGGTGNISLYVGEGSEPTSTAFKGKSTRAGNAETVRVTAPVSGTYYVKVVGEAAFSGVSLLATQ